MENINKYIYEISALNELLNTQEKIVVYGAGEYGKRLIDYICSIKKEDKIIGIIVTQMKENHSQYKQFKIQNANSFFLSEMGCYVIIAVSVEYQNQIANIINKFKQKYCYITEKLYMEMRKEINANNLIPYQGIDFLLVGFTKCGTTSLYRALRDIDEIYLSDKKESVYFSWCDKVEDSEKKLINYYLSSIKKNQVVGMIEPSFFYYAKQVHKLFGNNIKIIFLMRNPVEATFSEFKMRVRQGRGELQEAYKKSGKFYEEMFDEHFERCTNEGVLPHEYIYWIKNFQKYYKREQIKIIFFEEMIKEPDKIINDILKFIGVLNIYTNKNFPYVNEGNFVMADEHGYIVAKRMMELIVKRRYMEMEDIQEIYKSQSYYEVINNQFEAAEKLYGVKMTDKQRKKLENYFNESVRRLEKYLDKDLSNIWF